MQAALFFNKKPLFVISSCIFLLIYGKVSAIIHLIVNFLSFSKNSKIGITGKECYNV